MRVQVESTCTEPGDKPQQCSHYHAQGSISDANYGPEPFQCGPLLTFPVSCLCLQVQIQVCQVVIQIACVRVYV